MLKFGNVCKNSCTHSFEYILPESAIQVADCI